MVLLLDGPLALSALSAQLEILLAEHSAMLLAAQ
jgi:hypothetical protein